MPDRAIQIAVCLPGADFSSRWVKNWTLLFGHLLAQKYSVIPLFEFTASVYHTRESLASICRVIPDLDYVLWIDDDNIMDAQQFDRLMTGLNEHPEIDAIFGWCWAESDQYEMGAMISCGVVDEETGKNTPFHPSEIIGHTQLMQVGYSGFPAVLMRASLLSLAGDRSFMPMESKWNPMGFAGEDYAFCRRAIETGAKLYVDPLCQVPHLKLRAITPTNLLKFWDEEVNNQKGKQEQQECAA